MRHFARKLWRERAHFQSLLRRPLRRRCEEALRRNQGRPSPLVDEATPRISRGIPAFCWHDGDKNCPVTPTPSRAGCAVATSARSSGACRSFMARGKLAPFPARKGDFSMKITSGALLTIAALVTMTAGISAAEAEHRSGCRHHGCYRGYYPPYPRNGDSGWLSFRILRRLRWPVWTALAQSHRDRHPGPALLERLRSMHRPVMAP